MEIKFLDDRITQFIPTKEGDVGYDLRACRLVDSDHKFGVDIPSINLYPGAVVKIGAGIALHQTDTWASVVARSGLGCRKVRPANNFGVVDTSYQGEIIVCLENAGDEMIEIKPMDRIAQLVFHNRVIPELESALEFTKDTARGATGFGSSGV